MLHHRAFCWDYCTVSDYYAWRLCALGIGQRIFALISKGQRRSSNLGFRTIHAEQQCNTFMLPIYISADFCCYDTSAKSSYRPIYIGMPIYWLSSSLTYFAKKHMTCISCEVSTNPRWTFAVEIDWYGFFGANTNMLAIHGPIADTNN